MDSDKGNQKAIETLAGTPDAGQDVKKSLAERAQRRAKNSKLKQQMADESKDAGNLLFRQGKYPEAIEMYEQAIVFNGPRPVYLLNLAAAYLKLDQYESAGLYATRALLHDPTLIKARYRRALARKGVGQLFAAKIDLETILKQDPNCAEAQTELQEIRNLLQNEPDRAEEDISDDEYPSLDDPKVDLASMSDTSDFAHEGNGIPCRFYNHAGCNKGRDCSFSHAPDPKSVRDDLGKNVCIFFLVGNCKFGDSCVYSHTRAYLPYGRWWDDPEKRSAVKVMLRADGATRDAKLMPFMLGMMDNRLTWNSTDGLNMYNPMERFMETNNNFMTIGDVGLGAGPSRTSRGRDARAVSKRRSGAQGNGSRARGKGPKRGKGKGKTGRRPAAQGTHLAWEMERDRAQRRALGDYGDEFGQDEMDERAVNGGFTDYEVSELMMQGIKPWDEDAWDVLDALQSF
ncbi:hypothetical protein BV25DRAFT_1989327 [Artomyces pyxidatus]|uniref:Uncharacterized protein n=1 Tax=Artomyces pyxidatus TaxID=48021 RepID=A0ACB8TAP0_9AGAM|nr:hypothetical protein BV25DRAFT_1989327 [Artomyces pyxidatus]